MAVYLNTYQQWQAYGGPEEGGWWYECGKPLQSVLVSNDDLDEWREKVPEDERLAMIVHATECFTEGRAPTPRKNGYGGYEFAPGSDEPLSYHRDDDVRSWFEDHFAEDYPQERPYYC